MFLLVFITFMLSILGIYVELFTTQMSALYSNQRVVAETMLKWHFTALGQAKYALAGTVTTAVGCSLTGSAIGTAPKCLDTKGNAVYVTGTWPTLPALGGSPPPGLCQGTSPATPCWTLLPSTCAAGVCTAAYNGGFYNSANTGIYNFYSLYYTDGAQSYVVTYVPKPATGAFNPSPGFLLLPDGNAASPMVGITIAELSRQLTHTSLPQLNYGMVQGGKLVTSGVATGAGAYQNLSYTLPTGPGAANLPDGSVAVITAP